MMRYRIGMVNEFHLEFKPVFRYSKPRTCLKFIGEEQENEMLLFSVPRPLEIWKSGNKVKETHVLKKGREKITLSTNVFCLRKLPQVHDKLRINRIE